MDLGMHRQGSPKESRGTIENKLKYVETNEYITTKFTDVNDNPN